MTCATECGNHPVDRRGRAEPRKDAYLCYFQAILIFLGSRLVVALGLVFSRKYLPVDTNVWSAGPLWFHQLLQWDSEWYFKIATDGYRYNGDPLLHQNVVFYPLYPMLSRIVGIITGLSTSNSLLLVSNVAGFCEIILLFKLVREEFGDQVGLATVALLSFFPTSVLLSAGYTEPLALLMIVSFFLVLKRKQYLWAALFAGLALATRSTGIVLLPVLLWEIWSDRKHLPFFRTVVPCVIIGTSGLWLFMAYLWVSFGNPWAFSEAQSAYHDGTAMGARVLSAIKLEPFSRMVLDDWNPWGRDSWITLLVIAAIIVGSFRLRISMTLFALGTLLLPYLTLSGGPAGFVSMGRFNLVSFPVFIVFASFLVRMRWLMVAVIGLSGAVLFMDTVLFARRIWIG